MRFSSLTIVLVCVVGGVQAQIAEVGPVELGIRGGIMNYQGDLQTSTFNESGNRLVLGAMARVPLATQWAARAVLEVGTLGASDLDAANTGRARRGFSFEARLTTVELTAEYSPFRSLLGGAGGAYNRLNPYVFAGLGFTRAKAEVSTANAADSGLFPEADDRSNFLAIPVGGGVRYEMPGGVTFGVEGTVRSVLSDHLDGISANANDSIDDYYWSAVAFVSVKLSSLGGGGQDQGCPTW